MAEIPKIGIGVEFAGWEELHKFSKNTTLEELVDQICQLAWDKISIKYKKECSGLQFAPAKNEKKSVRYITEENFNEIKDGDILKLVHSLEVRVRSIFETLDTKTETAFEDLMVLSTDPAFIKEIKKQNKLDDLKAILLKETTNRSQFATCLGILIHMITMNELQEVEDNIVSAVIANIKDVQYTPDTVQYSVDFLKRLLEKKNSFEETKSMILRNLHIKDLKPLLKNKDHRHLQVSTIMLMNTIIQTMPELERASLINLEMNSSDLKCVVYDNILWNPKEKKRLEVSPKMAAALYCLQTYILAPLKNKLLHMTKPSTCWDFFHTDNAETDNLSISSRCSSIESLTEGFKGYNRTRYSSISSNDLLNDNWKSSSEEKLIDDSRSINFLTVDCMSYLKSNYPKSFARLKKDSKQETDFFNISEDLVQGLSTLLDLDKCPDRRKDLYQPLVFLEIEDKKFMQELFCYTVWFYERTKREMRSKDEEDCSKVLKVVLEGIHLVLQKHPINYRKLKEEVYNMSYRTVSDFWEKEDDIYWAKLLDTHPSIQELKTQFTKKNTELIYQERLNWMKNGEKFPKHPEKSKNKSIWQYLRLSPNEKMLYIGDWDEELKKYKQLPEAINISTIQHLITGGACPHYKENKSRFTIDRCFSLFFEDEKRLDFYGKNRKVTDRWIDGLNYLLEKSDKSQTFQDDLKVLLEMEIKLQLLDLQNVAVPFIAPKVPDDPLTPGPKPLLPKKTKSLCVKAAKSALLKNKVIHKP